MKPITEFKNAQVTLLDKMKTKFTLVPLLLLLFSCGDKMWEDEPFSVKVNGKRWIPTGSNDFKAPPAVSIHFIQGKHFWIRAKSGRKSFIFGVIDTVNGIKVGDYVLSEKQGGKGHYSGDSNNTFSTDNSHTGLLSITKIDWRKETVTGKFYYKARNPVSGEIVDISKGRFNARYVKY